MFCLYKINKSPIQKSEGKRPGEMIIICAINNNIIISHLSYSGLYQDESGKYCSTKR